MKYLKPFQPCACESDDKTMSSEKGVGVTKEVSRVREGGAKSVSDSSSLFDSTGGDVGVERREGGDEALALSTLPLPPKKSRDSASADDFTEDRTNKEQKGKKLQNTFVYQRSQIFCGKLCPVFVHLILFLFCICMLVSTINK